MSALSNYLENALVNAVLRNTTYTSPATVYVALFTTNPNEDASGTEVSGSNYSRMAVTFAAPSNGSTSNSALITFPTPSGAWGTITHFGIFDAASSGNLLWYGALDASIAITGSTTIFTFQASSLTCSLA